MKGGIVVEYEQRLQPCAVSWRSRVQYADSHSRTSVRVSFDPTTFSGLAGGSLVRTELRGHYSLTPH